MKNRLRTLAFVAGVALLAASPAGAREVRHGVQDFLDGELEGLALDELGQLTVAPVAPQEWATEALHLWSLAVDRKGRLVVGTGNEGTLYRERDGQLEEWADTIALEVLSLLPRPDGAVLAGTSPDGVVYRIDDDGRVSVALDLPQQSVWALAEGSREGTWLAGTGPGARIVRGGRGAEAGEELHRLPAANTTVLLRRDGTLWVGTQGPALVLRVDGNDTATPRLVYEAKEPEIRALLPAPDGGVYALAVEAEGGPDDPGHSRIVWLPSAGGRETVWEGDTSLLSLVALGDGSFLAGEAGSGRVLRVGATGRVGLWAEVDGVDPMALLRRGDETFVATGNRGTLFRLAAPGGGEGVFESPVIATPMAETWGRLWVEGRGESVRFEVRSGVRAEPDDTWSEWTSPEDSGGTMAAPVAPYLQYRLRLEKAEVGGVHVAWADRNLPPKLDRLRVEEPGGDLSLGGINASPSQVSQRFDDGLAVEYSLYQDRRRAEPEEVAWARGLRSIVWQADDPNDDALRFRVEIRRLPDGGWQTLAEDHTERVYAWDTRAYEDGHYRVRVTADDEVAQPAGRGRQAQMTSAAVHVDNTPPRFAEVDARDGELRLRVEDAGSPLQEIASREDDGDWKPVQPEDGVLDSPAERLRLPLDAHPDASRLWLRAVDRAGNVSVREVKLRDR